MSDPTRKVTDGSAAARAGVMEGMKLRWIWVMIEDGERDADSIIPPMLTLTLTLIGGWREGCRLYNPSDANPNPNPNWRMERGMPTL